MFDNIILKLWFDSKDRFRFFIGFFYDGCIRLLSFGFLTLVFGLSGSLFTFFQIFYNFNKKRFLELNTGINY